MLYACDVYIELYIKNSTPCQTSGTTVMLRLEVHKYTSKVIDNQPTIMIYTILILCDF